MRSSAQVLLLSFLFINLFSMQKAQLLSSVNGQLRGGLELLLLLA